MSTTSRTVSSARQPLGQRGAGEPDPGPQLEDVDRAERSRRGPSPCRGWGAGWPTRAGAAWSCRRRSGPSTTHRSPSATDQSSRSTNVAPSRRTLTCAKCSTSDMTRQPIQPGPTYPDRRARAVERRVGWPPGAARRWPARSARTTPPTRSAARGTRRTGCSACPARPAAVNLPYALARLRSLGVTGLRLVLPRPGDAAGLPGPPDVQRARRRPRRGGADRRAAPRSGCSTRPAAPGRCTRSRPTARTPLALRDADRDLHDAMREGADVLSRLDVARWEPAAAEVLAARSRAMPARRCRWPADPEAHHGARAGAADHGHRRAGPGRRRRGGVCRRDGRPRRRCCASWTPRPGEPSRPPAAHPPWR